MLREEFEKRTGFYPTEEYYAVIEKAYMECRQDKDTFCKMYKTNKDFLAESIRNQYIEKLRMQKNSHLQEMKHLQEELIQLSKENSYLRKRIEDLEEWNPYDDKLFSDQDYYELVESCKSKCLSDEEAINLIYKDFGFARSQVSILHDKPVYQINRLRQLREIKRVERKPYYFASDYYYCLFECRGIVYEIVNGTLTPYVI